MILWHATDRKHLAAIQAQGLRVACADPTAKIRACWMASASNRPWSVLHTIRKHKAQLEDVIVIEVQVPRSWLTRFREGLWYATQDIPASRLGQVVEGSTFGASASN